MQTVLITRPATQAAAFAKELPDGWQGILSPLIEIVPLGGFPDLADISGLILTSRNAVGIARPHLEGTRLPAYCVGPNTTEAARDLGLEATNADGDISALQQLLVRLRPKGRLLHLRGRHAAGQLAGWRGVEGCEIVEHVLYDQAELPLTDAARTALEAGKIDAIALFSPRTARILKDQLSVSLLTGPRLLCLSRNVAAALDLPPPARIEIAERPERAAMMDLFRR